MTYEEHKKQVLRQNARISKLIYSMPIFDGYEMDDQIKQEA